MEVKSDTEKTSRPLVYKLVQRSDVAKMVWPLYPSKSNDPATHQPKQSNTANSQASHTTVKASPNPSSSGPTVVQNQLVHYNIMNQGTPGIKSPSFNDASRATKESEASGSPRKFTPTKKATKVTKIQFGSDLSSNTEPTAYSNMEPLHHVRKLVLPSDAQSERASKLTSSSNLNSLPIFSNSEVTVTSSGKSFSPFSNRPSKDLGRKTAVIPYATPKGDEKETNQSQKNSGIAVVRNQLVHYNIVTQGHPNMKLPPLSEPKLSLADQGRKLAAAKMAAKQNNKKRIILSPNMNISQPAKILVLPPNMETVDPTKKIILPSNSEQTKAASRPAVHSNLTSPDPANRFVLSPEATGRGYSQFNQQAQSNNSTKKYILSPNMTSPERTNRFVLSPSTEAEKRHSNMESTEAANILVLLSNMDSAGANRPVTHSHAESAGTMEPAGLSALPSNMALDDEVQVVPPKATEIEVYDDEDDRKSLFGLDFEMTELVSSADVLKSLIGYKNYNVLLSALCSIKDLATKSKALAAFFSTNKEFRSAHSQTESVQKDSMDSRNFILSNVHTSSNETQTFLPKKQSAFTQTQTVILSPKRKTSFTQTLKHTPRRRTCFTQTETDLARGKCRLAQTQTVATARRQPQPGIFTSSPIKKKNIVHRASPAAETRLCVDRDVNVLDSETTLPEVSEPPEECRQNASEDPLAYDNNGLLGIHRSVLLHDFEGVRHWGETLRSLGHSVDQRSRPDGYTPLHLALLSGCGADILFQLLGHGASAAVPDGRGRPTLLLAAKPRAPRRGAPAPVASPLLPLLAATQPQALELVCRQTDSQGNTTLMYCARQGWAEQVQLLLEHSPPAVVRLAHAKSGKTALCMAMEAVADRVSSGQPVEPALRCVELLKQALASAPDSPQKPPQSPLKTPVLRKRENNRVSVKETNASIAPPKKKMIQEANEKKVAKIAGGEVSLNKDELKETVAVGDQVMGMPVQKVIPCNLKIIFTPSKEEGIDRTDCARSVNAELKSTEQPKSEGTTVDQIINSQESSVQETKPKKVANKKQPDKRDSLSVSMADSPILMKKSRKSKSVVKNAANKMIAESTKKDDFVGLNADVLMNLNADVSVSMADSPILMKKSRKSKSVVKNAANKMTAESTKKDDFADLNADVLMNLNADVSVSMADSPILMKKSRKSKSVVKNAANKMTAESTKDDFANLNADVLTNLNADVSVSIADSPILMKKSRKSKSVVKNAANKMVAEITKNDDFAGLNADVSMTLNADVSAVAEPENVNTAQDKLNLLDKSKIPEEADSLNKSLGELRASKRVAGNAEVKDNKVLRSRSEVSQGPAGKSGKGVVGDLAPSKTTSLIAAGETAKSKLPETEVKQDTVANTRKSKPQVNAVKEVQVAKEMKIISEKPDISIVCFKSGEVIGSLERNTDNLESGVGSHVAINKQMEETESNDVILNPLLGDENSLLKENKIQIKRHYVKKSKIRQCKKTIDKSTSRESKITREKIATSVVSAAKVSCKEKARAASSLPNTSEADAPKDKKVRNVGLKTVSKNYSNLTPLDDVVQGKTVVQISVKNVLYSTTLASIARDKFIQPRVVISPIINRSVRDFFCVNPSRKVRRKFDKEMTAEFDKIAVDIMAGLPDEASTSDYDSVRAAELTDQNPAERRDPDVVESADPVQVFEKKISTERKRKYEILAPLKNKWKVKLKLSPTSTKKLRAGGKKPRASDDDAPVEEELVTSDGEATSAPPPPAAETPGPESVATFESENTKSINLSAHINENPKSIVNVANVATPSADATNAQRDSKKTVGFLNVKKLSEQSLQVFNVSTTGSPSKNRVDETDHSRPSSSDTKIVRGPEQSYGVGDIAKPSGSGNVKKDLKKTSASTTTKGDLKLSLEVCDANKDPQPTLDLNSVKKVAKESSDVTKQKKDPKQGPDVTDDKKTLKHSSDVKRDFKNVPDNTKLKKDPKQSSNVSKITKGGLDKPDPAVRAEDVKGKKISKSSPDVANAKRTLDAASVSKLFNRSIPAINMTSPLPVLGKKRRYSLGSIEHDLEIINRAVAMQEAPDLPPPVLSYLLLYPN